MSVAHLSIAHEILEIIPLVMHMLRAELRQPAALANPGHFHLLLALADGPHSLSELAEKHNVTLPTMSSTVSTLVEHGLIRRTRSVEDRRRLVIELTGEGADLLLRIRDQAALHIAAVLEPLSDEERIRLTTGLSVLRTAFTRRSPH